MLISWVLSFFIHTTCTWNIASFPYTHTRQAYAVTKQNCEHSVNQLYCVYIPAGHSDLLNIVGTTYCLTDTIKYLIPHTHTCVKQLVVFNHSVDHTASQTGGSDGSNDLSQLIS